MEKVIWVNSNLKMIGARENNGLEVVNKYLEEGWTVKHITACALGQSVYGQAYIVIQKNDK